MEQLKLVAQSLGLPIDSTIEKVLEAIGELSKKATEGGMWEQEAHDSLAKLERTERLATENASLRAELLISKAVDDFKIEAYEAEDLKEMFLKGDDGEAWVKKHLSKKKKNDYFSRKASLNARDIPSDPIAEIETRSAEIVAKSNGNISKADAMIQVQTSDTDFAARYRDAVVKGAKEGGR